MAQLTRSPRAAAAVVAVVATLVTFFAQPAAVTAQETEPKLGPVGFGLQGGILNEDGSPPTRPLFGALLRFRLEANGAVSWRDTSVPGAGDVTVYTIPVFANILFYLFPGTTGRPATLSPYLSGGGGAIITRIEPDAGSSDTTTDIGGNVGAGLDIRLGANTTFTVDARYLFVDRASDLDAPGGVTRIEVGRRGYTITGQLTFYF